MHKIKAIIIDDEIHGIEALKWELGRAFSEIEIVNTFTSPIKAIKFLESTSVDLVFLDIQMPEMTGFEMLEKLKNINFSVVFVTSYDQFALKAFQHSALDYIIKPADKESLKRALSKFKNNNQNTANAILKQLEIHKIAIEGRLPSKVVFSTKDAFEFINPNDILYCESDSNYCTIYLENSTKLVISKTLKETEEQLCDYGFQRIHQSYLVNLSYVKRFIKTDGGYVELITGKQLPVSKSKKDAFILKINQY